MSKKKALSYYEKMVAELNKLPVPLEDKRHNLFIYFENDKARSNQTRYEHMFVKRHKLTTYDIDRIYKGLKKSILKKDKERTDTYNMYIKRFNTLDNCYIKLSLHIEERRPNIAYVKTIFITNWIK